MARLIKKTSKKAGLSPGSMVHIGEKKIDEIKMTLINFDPEQLLEEALPTIELSFPYKDTPPVTWINVDGLHEVNVIEKIGDLLAERYPETLPAIMTGQIAFQRNSEGLWLCFDATKGSNGYPGDAVKRSVENFFVFGSDTIDMKLE